MLTTLKKLTSGWITQLLLGLLALSFVLWGVADVFTGFGRGSVATVGETEVSVSQFQSRYTQSVNTIARNVGRALSPTEAVQLGIPSQVLGVLISEAALTDTGSDMGLGLSDETLSRLIRSDPAALGPTGLYSELALRANLASNGMTIDEFVVARRQEYTRNQLIDAFAGEVETPQAYLRAFSEYRDEKRTIDYVVVRPAAADEVATPTGGEIEVFFAERQEDWRAPEYRAIRYVHLDIEALARPEEVLDEAISARYEEQRLRFTSAGRRTLRQIIFEDEGEASAAAAELSAGATFDDVAEAHDVGINNLGELARDEIVGEAVADAAFSLQAGETSGVIDGPFGYVILDIVDAVEEQVLPLEEVADSLRTEIANQSAAAELTDMRDVIEDARAGGSSLVQIAEQNGLPLVSPDPFDEGGVTEAGVALDDLPTDNLVAGAFESDVGLENNPLRAGDGGFVWYDVTAVTAPRLRTLDEVRDSVVAAWQDEQRGAAASEEADAILDRLKSGQPLEQIAADLVLEIRIAEGVTRSGGADLPATAVNAAFEGPEGHAAAVDGAEPLEKIVLTVSAVDRPAFFSGSPDLEPVDAQLRRQIAVGLVGLYAAEVQAHRNPRINQQVLNQLVGDLPTAVR